MEPNVKKRGLGDIQHRVIAIVKDALGKALKQPKLTSKAKVISKGLPQLDYQNLKIQEEKINDTPAYNLSGF